MTRATPFCSALLLCIGLTIGCTSNTERYIEDQEALVNELCECPDKTCAGAVVDRVLKLQDRAQREFKESDFSKEQQATIANGRARYNKCLERHTAPSESAPEKDAESP